MDNMPTAFARIDRSLLDRVIAIINGKGGCGKTTIAANLSGWLQDGQYNILLVGLDPQGDLARHFHPDIAKQDPNGQAFVEAAGNLDDEPPFPDPIQARPNLDVYLGGSWLNELRHYIDQDGDAFHASFIKRFADVVARGGYDIVLIDCPPGNAEIQYLALLLSRYIVVPVKTDDPATVGGLKQIGPLASRARRSGNPTLEYLGYVIFGHAESHTAMLRETITDLEPVADRIPRFNTRIRQGFHTARACRKKHVLIDEYLPPQAKKRARQLAVQRRKDLGEQASAMIPDAEDIPAGGTSSMASNATDLAVDSLVLADEILRLISQRESAQDEPTLENAKK